MANEEAIAARKGREGGRWINERPTSEEFGQWFRENMKIDPKLKVDDYVGGVVLIPAVDTKAPTVTGFRNGAPVIERREELSYIPYAKVETRINYFWDLVAAHEEDWVAVVEHVESPRIPLDFVTTEEDETKSDSIIHTKRKIRQPSAMTGLVHQLPTGFSIASVPVGQGYSHFLCCTIRVSIYRKTDYDAESRKAVPIRTGRGTKQVPLTKSYNNRTWADESSLMKAETGALGRALGFAGIFVIPGSGVATAEDMADAAAQGSVAAEEAPAEPNGPAVPAEPPVRTGAEQAADEETQLRQRATALFTALKEDHPELAQRFGKWAHEERKLTSLGEARGAVLRGVVKKLEKLTDEAEAENHLGPKEAGDVNTGEATETRTSDEPGGEEATGDGDEPSGQAG